MLQYNIIYKNMPIYAMNGRRCQSDVQKREDRNRETCIGVVNEGVRLRLRCYRVAAATASSARLSELPLGEQIAAPVLSQAPRAWHFDLWRPTVAAVYKDR
jgi:hypothetical protein